MRLALLLIATFLAACAQSPPPAALVTVTPAAPDPVLAAECWAPDPADPQLPKGWARMAAAPREEAMLRHLAAGHGQVARLKGLRRICRASLKATFPRAAPAKKAARPVS